MAVRTALMAMVAIGGLGCTLSRFAYTPCTTNKQCRDSFGWGSVCTEERLCAEVEPTPRCDETYPTDLLQRSEYYADAIIVGLQMDRSAYAAEMGAAELAIREVMRAGGLAERPVGIVKCTNEANSMIDAMGQNAANAFVTEYLANEIGAVAIVGPNASDRVDDAFSIAERFGTLLMSPMASSTALTSLDGDTSSYAEPGLLWRTVPPDDIQGDALAAYAREQGLDRVAVVFEDAPYGEGIAEAFQAGAETETSLIDMRPYTASSSASLSEQIDAARNSTVDAVLFVSSQGSDIAVFLQAVVDWGRFDDKRILLADVARDSTVFESVADLNADVLARVHGTAPAPVQTPVYDTFAAEYALSYPGFEADRRTALAYDAAWLVLHGAAWAQYNEGAMTGLGVARGLRQLSDPGGEPIDVGPSDWVALQAQFGEGERVDVRGASGELDYDKDTAETSSAIEVWAVREVGGGYQFNEVTRYTP